MDALSHVINVLVFILLAASKSVIGQGEQRFRVEPIDQKSVYGQTIFLHCEIDDLVGQVTWMRDGWGLGTEIDLPGYHRYELDGSMERGEYSLMISNLRLEDDAKFQCQVMATTDTQVMVSRVATITVLVPPSDPVIYGGPNVEVVAGEPYNLTCNAANGKPAPAISWFAGSLPVTQDAYYYAENQNGEKEEHDRKRQNATGWLTVVPRKSDQGKRYYCEVSNEGLLGSTKSTSVALEVLYKPEVSMTVSPRHDRVKEGKLITFKCESIGNPSEMTWKWFRETEELSGETSSVMVQRANRDWHAVKIECEATNTVGSTRQSVTLNVEYAPMFTAGPEHVAADVGDDATLHCAVDGNPNPTVIWMKKDSVKILSSHKQLTIYGVQEGDFGVYLCKASILSLNEIQMEVHLMKKGPPKILSSLEQSARFGETGVVECRMMSVPKPVTIIWFKDGEPIAFDELDRYQSREEDLPDGKRSIIEIRRVQDKDFGHYNCSVSNGYGTDAQAVTFTRRKVVPLEFIIGGVLIGVFIIIVLAVVLVVYRRKKAAEALDSDSETSVSSISKRKDGGAIKVEYPHGAYGNPSIVEAWQSDTDKNLYRRSADYDELNYVPKDPWLPQGGYDYRDGYGSPYGGGYAKSDYGTYPGPASRHIYDSGNYGSQNIYGGPTYSDYGIYGTYGRRPPPRPEMPPAVPRSDFIPASELGRPSTAMSSRLATNV